MGFLTGVAVDTSENIFVTDLGNIPLGSGSGYSNGDIFKWNYASGTWQTYSVYQYLNNPMGITRDKNNNIWVANTGANDIVEFNDNLSVEKTISGHGLNQPFAVAIDSSGDIWAANYASNDVLEFSSSGTLLATLGGSGNGWGSSSTRPA